MNSIVQQQSDILMSSWQLSLASQFCNISCNIFISFISEEEDNIAIKYFNIFNEILN